jgi:hypothetical protein
MTRDEAIANYRAKRAEWMRLGDLADATFKRYFLKLQNGTPTNGAACARMDARVNFASADLYSAQGFLYKLDIDPWTIDDEDGVEHTPVGA